jgi:hypothetical protein
MVLSLTAACRSAEEELVDRFLRASQRGDSETVAALSLVAFPEEIPDWEFVSVGPLRSEPYRIPELRADVEAAEDRRDAQFKEFGEFRQQHYDDLARIQRRLRDEPDYSFTGPLLELNEAWEQYRQARRDVVTRLHEAEMELEREIRRVNRSLQRESTPEYLTGEMLLRDLRVRIAESGRTYVVTVIRYELVNQFDAVVPTRWIVAAVEPEA